MDWRISYSPTISLYRHTFIERYLSHDTMVWLSKERAIHVIESMCPFKEWLRVLRALSSLEVRGVVLFTPDFEVVDFVAFRRISCHW